MITTRSPSSTRPICEQLLVDLADHLVGVLDRGVLKVSTPQVSASCERTVRLGRERQHRDRAAQPRHPAGGVAGLGEGDDVLGPDPLGDLGGGLGDHAPTWCAGPSRSREVPTLRCSSAWSSVAVMIRAIVSTVCDGVLPHAGLARQHHRVGAVEHGVGDVGGLGAGGRRAGDHRLQHLGRHDDRLGVAAGPCRRPASAGTARPRAGTPPRGRRGRP